MKKITKADSKRKAKLVQNCKNSKTQLEKAIAEYNELVDKAFTSVNAATEHFNLLVEEVNSFQQDVANEIQSYMDDRSDRWHEGESAVIYEHWLSSWEETWDDVSIEEPEEILLDDTFAEFIQEVEDLPEELPL